MYRHAGVSVPNYDRILKLAAAKINFCGCNSSRMKYTENSKYKWDNKVNDVRVTHRVTLKFKSLDDLLLFKLTTGYSDE